MQDAYVPAPSQHLMLLSSFRSLRAILHSFSGSENARWGKYWYMRGLWSHSSCEFTASARTQNLFACSWCYPRGSIQRTRPDFRVSTLVPAFPFDHYIFPSCIAASCLVPCEHEMEVLWMGRKARSSSRELREALPFGAKGSSCTGPGCKPSAELLRNTELNVARICASSWAHHEINILQWYTLTRDHLAEIGHDVCHTFF